MSKQAKRVAIGIDMDWPMSHHHGVARGVVEYGRQHGWQCEFNPTFETAPTLSADQVSRFDGVVARASQALGKVAAQTGVPVVNVWYCSPEKTLPRVHVDKADAGRKVGQMFVEQGFKNFGFLWFYKDRYATEMAEAFRRPFQEDYYSYVEMELDVDLDGIDEPRWERMHRMLNRWIDSWTVPIAVLVTDHILTRYLADFCLKRGLSIPDDVALVAGEDNELICASIEPALTAIDNGFEKVGYEAAALLDQLMAGRPAPSQTHYVQSASIVRRRSTDVHAVEDRMVARVLRLVADHSHRPINVEWVTNQLPVTRRTLERRFRQAMGRSIRQHIVETRMARARQLLLETDEPVKSVAVLSGFRDAEHLCKIFSHLEGISPGRFRRKHRSSDNGR